MPRAQNEEFLQNFRFHVKASFQTPQNGVTNPLFFGASPDGSEAGFQSATLPEITVNKAEYRHGLGKFTIYQPGIPSMNDLTFMRGVVRRDTTFFDAIMRYLNGQEYRMDLRILVFPQDAAPDNRSQQPAYDESKALIYNVYEAFCTRAKPGSDLDATSDEVSMQEADFGFEHFDIDTSNL